ncbi:phosphoribosylaminoimidazolesuccinocarboxamide synthase [Ehrlichia canis]|uniref:phosphoribosylaminoimidazolesuccinocarboxamide synthase n=1 Tax=Ehrlichia canis TaxID=944 RepID=UPI0005C77171|nr:phosphoribosylaminoimidazolesuccinocarboxamide synthase [Ehrlichia canis]AUO55191.1 phosphoribosylaminoimidazolesuccinocarboxamide synthase [Ehrlichia canis]UKC53461.1 phosphoribosylaminoimidazolesuccinocarboxamide synthase [Ehrlichia canis]UKC54397.1 phosphoribosylaminoimidazolesuccinocarboxamide synthase [Ehrlichia canis]UKC55334.1 phosphoribosylaminoimidazolesuccinocarboxamide synthase [Ehrlichia canis]
MKNREKIYEGKAKIIFATSNPLEVIQHFKDEVTAFNNKKADVINEKGIVNNYISSFLMKELTNKGIKTHFISLLNQREQLVKKVSIIPLEIVVRNLSAGNFSKRFQIADGTSFKSPIIEFYYKSDKLSDPMVSDGHILSFQWLTNQELEKIKMLSLKINEILSEIFLNVGIKLVDFKLEFGKLYNNKASDLLLADEISPDTCRLWNISDNRKLDKDLYRMNLGNVIEAYKEVAQKLNVITTKHIIDNNN